MFGKHKKVRYMDNMSFKLRMCHDAPVDVIDMANSLVSLADLTAERIGREHGVTGVKIMLNGVEDGSDIYDMGVALAAATLPVIDKANVVLTFTDFIRKFLTLEEKSLGEIEEDDSLTAKSADKINSFVQPLVSDASASFQISTGDHSPVTIIHITHDEAKQIRKNANNVRKIKEESEKIEAKATYSKVLLKMHKTIDTDKKVRDSAYCDEIVQGKAIATIIENAEDKQIILEDPYNNLFLVDIEVARADNKIKLYRVTKLYDVIPRDDSE